MKRPIVYQAHEKSYQYKYKDHFRNPESLYSDFRKLLSAFDHMPTLLVITKRLIEHDLEARQ